MLSFFIFDHSQPVHLYLKKGYTSQCSSYQIDRKLYHMKEVPWFPIGPVPAYTISRSVRIEI